MIAWPGTPRIARAQSTVNRPAEIRGGTCGSPGESLVTLANVVLTPGDPQGQSGATPVEQSGTVVPYTLADLFASSHAVFVLKSVSDSTVVACGEVGGTVNPDGTLGVGLRSMDSSGVSGVAYFTPIDTFSNTLVTILLVSGETSTTTVSTEPGSASSGSASAGEEGLNKDLGITQPE
ncbi:MAG: hypothetical protein U0031_06295 [Thermomicrobiales bacterium]